jgi:YVTN family beta-propeller protein
MIPFRRTGFILSIAFILLLELGCGDQYRPVANPIIGPGGQPQTTHFAYVVTNNPAGNGSSIVIDVSGDTTTSLQTMGLGSIYEATNGSGGLLFIANRDNDSVSEYIPLLGGNITTINLLTGSRPVAVTSTSTSNAYVLNSGSNSACPTTGSISIISTTTLAVTNTVCVGVNPTSMVQLPGNGEIYVINQGDNSVSIFVPSTQGVSGTVTTAGGLGQNPTALAASLDGSFIFIATAGDGVNPGALDILPRYSGTVGASVALGVAPNSAIVDPNLNRLYVTNGGSNTVSVFDASNVNVSNSPAIPLLGTANVGTNPVKVAPLPNGTQFYVADSGSDDVTVVSASSFSTLKTIPLASGAAPVWVASEPTSTKVYVANPGTGTISVIQTVDNTIATNISAPTQVSGCSSSCALQQPVMIITQ